MAHDDSSEALAAHAIGAVGNPERRSVERLLAHCPEAREEFARHNAVAEALGAMHATQPPDRVWDRISAEIEPPPVGRLLDLAGHRRTGLPLTLSVAAAVVASLLGLVAILQFRHIGDLNSTIAAQSETIAATTPALQDPDTTLVSLRSPETDAEQMTIVVDSNGHSQVATSSLAALPADLVYQLWAIMDDGRVVSVALLDDEFDAATFSVATEGLSGFAVTTEIDGGVVSSSNDAVVVGLIDA